MTSRCVRDGLYENLWTVNDWWRFYPDLRRPDRVYQIHRDYNGNHATDPSRCYADWKDKYNQSGALIVTRRRVKGLVNQQRFDLKRGVSEFGKAFLGSSIGYMVADAIWAGADEIVMLGIRLADTDEYENQVDSIKLNIETARKRGIAVTNEFERNWRAVDWSKLAEVRLTYGD